MTIVHIVYKNNHILPILYIQRQYWQVLWPYTVPEAPIRSNVHLAMNLALVEVGYRHKRANYCHVLLGPLLGALKT